MAKPPIEYRPNKSASKPMPTAEELLEAYKAQERAKVAARVRRHRANKRAGK